MSAGIWFWLIYVFSILFGFYSGWPTEPGQTGARRFFGLGGSLVLLVLIGLLGWRAFGGPLK